MKKMVFQIAMTIGIIIFFLIILYQIYNLSMEGLAEEYTERQQVLTRQAASGIEGYFQHLEQITGLIASVPELREERFKEKHFEQIIYTSLETLKEQGVKNILILDRNGICKWQASGKNFLNLDLSKTEPFQISKDLKPPQFYISELSKKNILSPTPANEIIFGIPIYKLFSGINSLSSGEELSGCILLFIDSDYIFTKYITPLSQGKKGTVWVMDQKGTLIYLPEHPEMVFKNIFDKDKSCFSCHESFNPEKQMITANKFTGRNKINHSTKLLAATGFNLRQGLSGWVIATSSPFGKVAISARKSYFYILILTFSIILVLTVSSGYAIRINKKRAEALEEKVKASEEILYLKEYNENIVRNIPIGVIVIDKERKITSMNEEIVNQMRKVGVELKREEQIGKDILYQMPERLKEASSKIYDQALTEGISYEHSNITFEGKKGQFIYSVKISPLRDLKNMIVGAIITREDITQKRALEQEIKETKDYLESIFEASVDGIIVVDNKGVLTRANNAFLKMLGYSREELIGMHSRKFSTGIPEHIATNREMYALLMEKGKVSPVEIVYKKKDGSQLFVEQSAAYVKDKKENPSGSVGIIRDITEKKKLEQEIKETRDYLESIFEASVDGIIVTNNTGFLTMANNAFLKMLGYSREELIGMNTMEFSTGVPEHRAAQLELLALLMGKGKVPPIEMGFKKKDGSSFLAEETGAALNDKEGSFSGSVFIIRDITEKKKLEQEIKETKDYLESIFEASVDGIIVTNNTGFLTMANNAFLKMLGYSREELIGIHCMELSTGDPEHLATHRELFALLMKKGKVSPVEMGWKKKDGSSLPVEQTVAALNDKKGNLSGVVAILRDITEKKKAEERQKQLQHQLIQAEKMASIGRLTGGLAHEINNPLSGAVTNLELIKGLEFMDIKKIIDECMMANPNAECTRNIEKFYNDFLKIEEKRKRWLETAYKGGIRCKKIIKELLVFSRPSAPKEETEVDLNECIADSIDIIGHQLEIKNIKVEKEIKPDIPKIWGNKREIEQIFLNLFINASHAIGEKGGVIKVETQIENEFIIAKIKDTGCGIPKENIDKIFDPFFTTKEVGEGTGLGLSIIYELVEKLGGKIEVKSKVGVGTEFILSFPAYRNN
ncbi:MAG: hypothetical protein A2043_09820 [Candidatus Schekmanbacteria bacterium GWA2_38_9]|nr:MAG: hypothetical protein A2043_09820 [Candidatus Schekmanbacteria bacterium GWA2_38_9]